MVRGGRREGESRTRRRTSPWAGSATRTTGTARASAEPHSPQNFRPASFSAPHEGQIKPNSSRPLYDEGYPRDEDRRPYDPPPSGAIGTRLVPGRIERGHKALCRDTQARRTRPGDASVARGA